MITKSEDREVIKSGDFKEEYFKLAQNAHIFKILRDGIYSDKPLAVIREYWANARDEHIKIGKPELPVDISLPNFWSPYLKIRDYGKGLTFKEVKDVFISYGSSTKTDSNDYIGALGIGSKSGFCYAQAFQVTSYVNGKAATYSCYIDETEMGKIAEISVINSNEPSGVEISVPINTSDFELFYQKAQQLFVFAKSRPNIKGRPFTFDDPSFYLSGKNWMILERDTYHSYCVMGDIPYTLDVNAFMTTYSSVVAQLYKDELVAHNTNIACGTASGELVSTIKYPKVLPNRIVKLLDYHVMLRFEIGELDMAASREALSYKTKTILAIYDRLNIVVDALKQETQAEVDKCSSVWESKILFGKLFHNSQDMYSAAGILRAVGASNLDWSKHNIKNSRVSWEGVMIHPPKLPPPPAPVAGPDGKLPPPPLCIPAPVPITCFNFYRKNCDKLQKVEGVNGINADTNVRIIINDTNTFRGVFTAVNALMLRNNNAPAYYVFQYINQDNCDALVKMFDTDKVPYEYLSKIEIPKVENSYRKPSPKYSKKIFTYNGGVSSKLSDNWDIADVDPTEDEGIYIVIDRYNPQFTNIDSRTIKALGEVIKVIEGFEKKPLVVYGVKEKGEEDLGDNWVSLVDYCHDICAKIINTMNYNQLSTDYDYLKAYLAANSPVLELMLGLFKYTDMTTIPPHAKILALHQPLKVLVSNHNDYKKHEDVVKVMEIIGKPPTITAGTATPPSCDMKHVEKELYTNYPLLRYTKLVSRQAYSVATPEERKEYMENVRAYIIAMNR